MKLTKEEAVAFHIEMWTAMKEALGDDPRADARKAFKKKWCEEHFPGEGIMSHCFLCEYAYQHSDSCSRCPVNWGDNDYCGGRYHYLYAPISKILALPVREDV